MGADSRLVLYGNSVMLAGIATELQRHHRFDLITLEPGPPDALHRICFLEPRVVLFDLAALPDPLAAENLLHHSGRGLLLVRAFVDEFQVRKLTPAGTEVNLVKYLTKESQPKGNR